MIVRGIAHVDIGLQHVVTYIKSWESKVICETYGSDFCVTVGVTKWNLREVKITGKLGGWEILLYFIFVSFWHVKIRHALDANSQL